MDETYVRLVCPECAKDWQSAPATLPAHDETFHCPNCHNTRSLAEFVQAETDLQTLKSLQA